MFYVPIQKDFSNVKNKVALGLTRRQLICFALAGVIGIPTYLGLKKIIAVDIAGVVMILVMLPFFLLALYEKNGQPLEEVLKNIITEKYIRPQIRPVVNEPILTNVIMISDYLDEQNRYREEAKAKSIAGMLAKSKKKGGSNELETTKKKK